MIYHDIQNNTSLKVLNFAEDILLYKTFKKDSYKTGTTYVNLELDSISKWLKGSRLKINTDMTRCILFHSVKIDNLEKKIRYLDS